MLNPYSTRHCERSAAIHFPTCEKIPYVGGLPRRYAPRNDELRLYTEISSNCRPF